MDWKLVSDAISQALQLKQGVEGLDALPGLVDKAKMAASGSLAEEYREQIFDRTAQLARETADFGTNIYRDPVGMTSADYHTVMPKVIQAKQAYAAAIASAEQLGRLGEFYGKIGQQGAFDVAGMLAPISKLGLVASKPRALIKAVGELAHIGKGATKALGVAEAAAAAGALFSKRKFDMIARCPVETAATESADKPAEAPRPPVAAERPPEGAGAHAQAGLKEVFDNLSEFVAKAGKVVDVAGQLGIGGLGQAAKVLGGLGNASHLAAGALADGWPTGAIANFAGGGVQGSAGAFGDLPTENESAAETARLRLDEPEAAPPDQDASETAKVPDNRALLNADKDNYRRGDFGGRDVSKPGDTLTALFKSNYGHEPSAPELIQYANYNGLSIPHDLSSAREIVSPSLETLSQVGITKAQAESYLARDTQYQAAFKAMRDEAVQKQSADYAASENATLLSKQQEASAREPAFDFRAASIASRQAEDARAAAEIQRQNELGPQFRPIDPVAEARTAEARLRTKNSLEIALLGPFGVTGAAVRALGADENHVAVANELGAATFGLAGALAGMPMRGPINIGLVSYNNVNAPNYASEAFVKFEVGASSVSEIENDVLGRMRTGSATKIDPLHLFPDMVDNYVGDATKFSIPTKGVGGVVIRQSELYQVEGGLNSKQGIFEWIVDQNQVTHRRFIPNGQVTGFPNQIPPKP